MTRTSHRWQNLPGNYDTLHAQRLFPASNSYGIPDLCHTPVSQVPAWLVPYRQRIRANEPGTQGVHAEGCVHFFLDDYRFETVWNRPFKALEALRPYRTLLTPDFSLYRDWPLTLQLWNTYRLFVDGFVEMMRRLEPQVVLSYGRLPAACHELIEVVTYPTRWTNIRAARQRRE